MQRQERRLYLNGVHSVAFPGGGLDTRDGATACKLATSQAELKIGKNHISLSQSLFYVRVTV